MQEGVQQLVLGLYIIRGDNMYILPHCRQDLTVLFFLFLLNYKTHLMVSFCYLQQCSWRIRWRTGLQSGPNETEGTSPQAC